MPRRCERRTLPIELIPHMTECVSRNPGTLRLRAPLPLPCRFDTQALGTGVWEGGGRFGFPHPVRLRLPGL